MLTITTAALWMGRAVTNICGGNITLWTLCVSLEEASIVDDDDDVDGDGDCGVDGDGVDALIVLATCSVKPTPTKLSINVVIVGVKDDVTLMIPAGWISNKNKNKKTFRKWNS